MSETNLNILLILIVGVIIAFALLSLIKFWRARRGDLRFSKDKLNIHDFESDSRDSNGFDLDGIGPVRRIDLEEEFADEVRAQRQQKVEPKIDEESVAPEVAPEPELERPAPMPTEQINMFDVAEEPEQEQEVEQEVQQPELVEPQLVIALHLMAQQEPFDGDKLLKAMVSNGLKFGAMDIFHKHEQGTAKSPIMFSVANAVKPGIFEIENMKHFTTPGITLFLTAPGPKQLMRAYDDLIATAEALKQALNGEILDDSRNRLTKQTMSHYRDQIAEFERKQLAEAVV